MYVWANDKAMRAKEGKGTKERGYEAESDNLKKTLHLRGDLSWL